VRAAAIVADYVADAGNLERADRERRSRVVTFGEVATGYLCWLTAVARLVLVPFYFRFLLQ